MTSNVTTYLFSTEVLQLILCYLGRAIEPATHVLQFVWKWGKRQNHWLI